MMAQDIQPHSQSCSRLLYCQLLPGVMKQVFPGDGDFHSPGGWRRQFAANVHLAQRFSDVSLLAVHTQLHT